MKVPETEMSRESSKSKEAWGSVGDGETGVVDRVGSQRPQGPKSEIGVLF